MPGRSTRLGWYRLSDQRASQRHGVRRWHGEGAFKRWLDALTERDAAGGVTGGHIQENGVAMQAPAQMTFALQKEGADWRISAWTYAAPRRHLLTVTCHRPS